MLQNISQNRINKKITSNDFLITMASAGLTIYPGKTMYCISQNPYIFFYGHNLSCFLYCVKGVANGKASVLWQIMLSTQTDLLPTSMEHFGRRTGHNLSIVKYGSNMLPSSIYKDLNISNGEIKILVEFGNLYFYGKNENNVFAFADGTSTLGVAPRKAFGFFILNPKSNAYFGGAYSYFNDVIIFTPKPGLFDENVPT
jgi:hypothetical protein